MCLEQALKKRKRAYAHRIPITITLAIAYGGTHAEYNEMQQYGLNGEVHICPAYDMLKPAP